MTTCTEILSTIKEWLARGSPKADSLVDLPWEVEEGGRKNSLIAVYPRFPVQVNIICDDDIGVLRLFVSTAAPTISLSTEDRIRVYHKLLKMNAAPMAKFILYGDDDVIDIAVDLSIKTLGKQEFNDALALLLASVNAVAQELDLEEILAEQMFEEILRLVARHIEEGWGKDKLVEYLVERAGMKEDEASKLIDQILSGKKSSTPSIYQ